MLRFAALGSGSSGNSALVFTEKTTLLLDAGISAKQLRLRMGELGFEPEGLDAILLTHEHGDHVRGLEVFCRKVAAPVYCSPVTREAIEKSVSSPQAWRMIESGTTFEIGDIAIEGFTVMHDAVDPMGFVFEHAGSRLGFASDVGHVTGVMRSKLKGVHALFVEANYCDTMLQNDTKRPWSLKQRVSSRHGHLSNAQVCELVLEIAASGELEQVLLGHLSSDCNTPEVAENAVRVALQKERMVDIAVACAEREVPTGPFVVGGYEAPAADRVEPVVQAEFSLFS